MKVGSFQDSERRGSGTTHHEPRWLCLPSGVALALLVFGAAAPAPATTNLAEAYAAAGFDPFYPGNAVVVIFSDPHLNLLPTEAVVTTNFNGWLIAAINAMNPPPARIIVAGDLTSSYSESPGWPPGPANIYWATNEFSLWYPALSAFTNIAISNIFWVPGNHDQVEQEANADLCCAWLHRPPHQVITVAGVTFLLMNGGNCGMPSEPERQWVLSQAAATAPSAPLAVVVHQAPFSGIATERGIALLLRDAFGPRTNFWWSFSGHGHTQSDQVLAVGQSRVYMNDTATVNTNLPGGLDHRVGFYILGLSNGIAGSFYYYRDTGDFRVMEAPDWAHPLPFRAGFEDVPGLLWRRFKSAAPAPEVLVSSSSGSIYWYAYTRELQWALPLSRHANQATHFLLLSALVTGTVSFSADRTNWVDVNCVQGTNQLSSYPIPPGFISLPTVYARLLCNDADTFIGGWGLSSTNPPPWTTFPQLAAIPDQRTLVGRPVSVQAAATDPYVPPDVLSWSLLSAPVGATLDQTGCFRWTPRSDSVGQSSTVILKVQDAGTPEMSASRSFQIFVESTSAPALTARLLPGPALELRSPCLTGARYSLWSSTNLSLWTLTCQTSSPAAELRFVQPLDPFGSCFYRLLLVAQ
jgi:hypothetical protein